MPTANNFQTGPKLPDLYNECSGVTPKDLSEVDLNKVPIVEIDKDGEVVTGANMENACYRLGICAEISALTAARQAFGLDKVARIAVAGGHVGLDGALAGNDPVTPCGGCRQAIYEAADLSGLDIEVISANGDGTRTIASTIRQLLPHGFGPASLKDAG